MRQLSLRKRWPLLLVAALCMGSNCEDVKDTSTLLAIYADYKYHEICPNCCHHDWAFASINATAPTKQNPQSVCHNYYRCRRCGEQVEGPEIPCPPGWPGQRK